MFQTNYCWLEGKAQPPSSPVDTPALGSESKICIFQLPKVNEANLGQVMNEKVSRSCGYL